MTRTVRFRLMITIAVGVAGGVWMLLPPLASPPPDFTGQGFTAIRVELRGRGDGVPAVVAESEDPAVIAELAEVLRSGQPVVVCRCGALGTLEFRRPDGTTEQVLLMPVHEDETVEFRAMERGRYQVNREWFLRVVAPLGVAPERWCRWPDPQPIP